MEAPIRVVARVRPPSAGNEQSTQIHVASAASQIVIGTDHFCDFDAVFSSSSTQKEIYSTCLSDIVINFCKGVNTNVITYGQSQSGKTYTMTGPDILWAVNEEELGLVPQAIRHIFQHMGEHRDRIYKVHCTYLLIHNNLAFDLLSTSTSLTPLKLFKNTNGTVVLSNVKVLDCANITEVLNCLKAGLMQQRSMTRLEGDGNPVTGHALFTLTLEQQWTDVDNQIKYLFSRVNFVDLCGWDAVDHMTTSNGIQLQNDLEVLRNVIYCLANKSFHVPYKDSMLTHFIKDAFGGNSITLMVCCISAFNSTNEANYDMLKLGSLSRYIMNRPTINFFVQNPVISAAINAPTVNGPKSVCNHYGLNNNVPCVMTASANVVPPNRIPPLNGLVNGTPENHLHSHCDQLFKMQFAASQLGELVSSAEALFTEILQGGSLSPTEKSRIESWLCMKAEAEDCIGTDYAKPSQEQPRHLEVIEELSEPVDGSNGSDTESEISSGSSLGVEFYDQLHTIKNQFRGITEDLIENTTKMKDKCVLAEKSSNISTEPSEVEMKSIEKEMELDKENKENLPKESLGLLVNSTPKKQNSVAKTSSCESSIVDEELFDSSDKELLKRVSSKLMSVSRGSSRYVDNIRSKSSQLKKSIKSHIFRKKTKTFQHPYDIEEFSSKTTSSLELKKVQERLEELMATIKVKEALLSELKKSEREAEATRLKCDAQNNKLTKELQDLEEGKKSAQESLMRESGEEKRQSYRMELREYRREMSIIQKKMKSLQKVAAISQNTNANLTELETNLHELRVQQEELQTMLREGIQRKQQFQLQIIREDRSAKNPLCTSKLSDEENDRESGASSMTFLSIPSKKRKHLSSTGESEEKLVVKCRKDVLSSGSHDQLMVLRDIVQVLVSKRQKLNKKLRKSRTKGFDEERRVLELDELVEGLDFVKERLSLPATTPLQDSDICILTKVELSKILKSIPLDEIYHVLVRCFSRIVDIRIEFRKQEVAFAELEDQYDDQTSYISNLKSAYQQASLEMERRWATLQRVYQNKISTLLRQFNIDPTGKRFYETKLLKMEEELFYYKHLSEELKENLNKVLKRNKNTEGTSGGRTKAFVHGSPVNDIVSRRERRVAPVPESQYKCPHPSGVSRC